MESSQKKRRAMSTLKEEEGDTNEASCSILQKHEEDELSNLPDSVLVTIISFLPINVAAATSVLSRRWRNLWTHTTHLSVRLKFDDFQCFVTTVNHIISQLKSPKIHTFDLQAILSAYIVDRTQVSSDFLVRWIHQICLCNPEVIKVRFAGYLLRRNIFQIPHCLFETQSLVELELFGNFELNFLHDRMLSFKFPKLKKLALDCYDRHCALIGRNGTFFRACPVLEDLRLTLKFAKEDRIVDISTPNLKCLQIVVAAGKLKDCKFVIDAPKLEKCYIRGYLAFYEFVSNPSRLQEVVIDIKTACGGDNNYVSKIRGLIQGISCVRSLVFEDYEVQLLGSISGLYAWPIFHNLTHFSFCYGCDITDADCRLDELPVCFLLGTLKRVDIGDMACEGVEINLVQHILSNANSLEQLHISASHFINDEFRLQKEYEFCKKLFMISKSSVNCQIEFYGMVIIASSKDFRYGVLTCQIRDH